MNLGSLEFIENDFDEITYDDDLKEELSVHVNECLKEKLTSAEVLYCEKSICGGWFCQTQRQSDYDSHKAYMVCIEPIERDSMEKLVEDIAGYDLFARPGDKTLNVLQEFRERARKLKRGDK